MNIRSGSINKTYVIENHKLKALEIENLLTGNKAVYNDPDEFVINYMYINGWKKTNVSILMSSCILMSAQDGVLHYEYVSPYAKGWTIKLKNVVDGEVIRTFIDIVSEETNVFIDSVEFLNLPVAEGKVSWSRPEDVAKVHIPPYWTTLGQPVYYDSFFTGVEFMCADNRITEGRISNKIYYGRTLEQINNEFHPYVLGGAIGDNMESLQKSFFAYVATFARPYRFRIQFNSWYDYMLDITPDNIEESFRAVQKGFSEHGLRDIDCYVVDDGWVDYKKSEFWAFNKRFKDGFDRESSLTKELKSTFGVWFGPRGGYTEAMPYAKRLSKIGYNINRQAHDICTGDPKYIADLTDKMAEFMRKYNVTYFKIDGFSARACKGKRHGHPVGGYQNLYYYTYVWEQWLKGFEKLRKVNPDVFLNVTSYSNCSPWLLKQADAVWLNNAADMYYEGEGGDLDQCLNYRDGRYCDFYQVRQLQFPTAYIYNHEPCYGNRNYNPPLPNPRHKTVVYTDAEFEKYLYMCMMRGTGFIELYYSPSMFNDKKWDINAKVLTWAEKNFNIINKAVYFGGYPKNGEVYGYIAHNDKDVLLCIRNPHNGVQNFKLDTNIYTHLGADFTISSEYGEIDNIRKNDSTVTFDLKPFEMKIIRLKF